MASEAPKEVVPGHAAVPGGGGGDQQQQGKTIPLRYSVVDLLCRYLESNCLEVEGLMRISGTSYTVKEIWASFANDSVVLPADPLGGHNIANALKLYLREQPTFPLVPFDKYIPIINYKKAEDPRATLVQIIGTLPSGNFLILQRVVHLLIKIAEKSAINKMTKENLAIVMGPTLIRPKRESANYVEELRTASDVVLEILQNYKTFFPNVDTNPSAVQVGPVTVVPQVGKRRKTVVIRDVSQRPLRPRDFDMRPFINKKLVTQISPSEFEAVEDLLLVQRVEHNDVLTWTPHAQTPFILSPYYIVLTPRFFHFVDANTYRVKGTLPIKRVNSMSVDTLHKGFFSLHDADSREIVWMFLSYNDKIINHIVDIIRKNQALTITERKTVVLFVPRRSAILLEGGESEESQRAMAMMLQTLHKAGYNEQDILEGSADLHEVVKIYKDILTFRGGPKYVIEFLYPPNNPDFMGIYRKSYKLDRRTPVGTILRLLCAKARPGGVDTSQYVLCTLRGRTLIETENLASYGLGALFTSWQLRVMHKSHAKVISGTVVDFILPATPEFKGTTRKTVRVESERTVREAIHALFRHLRFTLEPHKFEGSTEDGKVLRDTAPLSEYGLGLKFMTMHIYVRPRTFPAINPNKEHNEVMVRSIIEALVDKIATEKINEKKRTKEQYCRDMLLYVLSKATYEISRASFLPLRVATLGRNNRDKIHDQLVRLENSELLRLNIQGYYNSVKRARKNAGQEHLPLLHYMTARELAEYESMEKHAEKILRIQSQQRQQLAQQGIFAPMTSPNAPPPPPVFVIGAKGTKKAAQPQAKTEPPAASAAKGPAVMAPLAQAGVNLMTSALFKKKAEEKEAQKSPSLERRASESFVAPLSPNTKRRTTGPLSPTVAAPPPNFARPQKIILGSTNKPKVDPAPKQETDPAPKQETLSEQDPSSKPDPSLKQETSTQSELLEQASQGANDASTIQPVSDSVPAPITTSTSS